MLLDRVIPTAAPYCCWIGDGLLLPDVGDPHSCWIEGTPAAGGGDPYCSRIGGPLMLLDRMIPTAAPYCCWIGEGLLLLDRGDPYSCWIGGSLLLSDRGTPNAAG